mgnify:CR=1 FL=1
MKPVLKFRPGKLPAKEKCIYRADELMLVYEVSEPLSDSSGAPVLAKMIDQQFGLNKPTELLLIADTLTLTFSGADKHLSSIDAYTNKQRWSTSSLRNVPESNDQGALLAEPDSFEGDRCSLGLTPMYEVASNREWVRVILNNEISDSYYEVASGLIVGLKSQAITEIFLLDVAFQ